MDFIPSTFDATFHGELDTNPWISKMPYRSLVGTGLNVSLLSYGGSSLAKFYGDSINEESINSIRKAIKCGVNYIDTSPWYGDSETLLGEALKEVPRNTYYIGTKVGRNFTPGWENRFDFSHSAVLKNVENSLSRMGLNYVDIIQIHDLEFCLDPQIILRETLPALESVVKAGKAKFIGITGYNLEVLKNVIETSPVKIDTILSYCRLNFHDTSLLNYIPYLESKKVGIINAAPVSMGLYTTRGPPDWHPASIEVKDCTKMATKFAAEQNKRIEDIAIGFGLRPSNAAIATTLVSMPNNNILMSNLEIVTKALEPSDTELYDKVIDIFKKNVKELRHWEGKEVNEYKKAMGINS